MNFQLSVFLTLSSTDRAATVKKQLPKLLKIGFTATCHQLPSDIIIRR